MAGDARFEGGCFCGAVRYRGQRPLDAAICHCRDCQRISGAPLLAWVEIDKADLEWTAGSPSYYDYTSDWPTPVRRAFCNQCGTQLTYEREGSAELDVTVASMDEPESVRPTHHVYTSSQASWLHLDDDMIGYERLRTDPED